MKQIIIGFRVMMFNATLNNISVISWQEIVIITFLKINVYVCKLHMRASTNFL